MNAIKPLIHQLFFYSLFLSLLVFVAGSSVAFSQPTFTVQGEVNLEGYEGSEMYGGFAIKAKSQKDVKIYCSISGSGASAFRVDSSSFTLESNSDSLGYAWIRIGFMASVPGDYRAVLTLTDSATTTYTIDLKGKSRMLPPLDLLWFGQGRFFTLIGDPAQQSSFILTNRNNKGNITFNSIILTGASKGVFSIPNMEKLPKVLTAWDSTNLDVMFNTGNTGIFHDTIIIRYTNPIGANAVSIITLEGIVSPGGDLCIGIDNDSSNVFAILNGDSILDRTYRLVNTNNNPLTITKLTGSSLPNDPYYNSRPFFLLTPPTLPVVLKKDEGIDLHLQFKGTMLPKLPRWSYLDVIVVTTEILGIPCEKPVEMMGIVHRESTDTSVLSIYPNITEKVHFNAKINADSEAFRHTIYLYNTDNRTKIVSIDFKNGTAFSAKIVDPVNAELPIILGPYMTIAIEVELLDKTVGAHNDQLIITTENGFTSTVIDLTATVQELDVKDTKGLSNIALLAQPNPAHGSVTLSLRGADHADVKVYDLLGTLVYSDVINSSWTWNGRASNGEALPNGTYIIRAVGQASSGKNFVTSSRVILAK